MADSILYHGLHVLSADGRVVGRVAGRIDDGDTDLVFVVVREARAGGVERLLPVRGERYHPGAVQLPLPAAKIDAAPAYDPRNWRFEEVDRAMTFWELVAPRRERRGPIIAPNR